MPNWGYSIKEVDPERSVRCAGRELSISPKAAVEVCRKIRGMRVSSAKEFLEAVKKKRLPVSYRRFKRKVAHKSGLDDGWYAGRYPVKAAETFLYMLEQLEANAEYKGLDIDRLRVIHAASHRGMKTKRVIQRAQGRATPYYDTAIHVELIGYEETE